MQICQWEFSAYSNEKTKKNDSFESFFPGATNRIRTGDLVITNDVLYRLSHSSIPLDYFITIIGFCQAF